MDAVIGLRQCVFLNSQLLVYFFEMRFMGWHTTQFITFSFQRAAVIPLSHGKNISAHIITGRVGSDVMSCNSPVFMSAAQDERSARYISGHHLRPHSLGLQDKTVLFSIYA